MRGHRVERRLLGLWAIALTTACHENTAIAPPPELGQSAILVTLAGPDVVAAIAVEGGEPLPGLVYERDGNTNYYVATYDQSLLEQRLVPGPIIIGAEGRRPNQPDHGYSLIPGTTDWEVASVPPSGWIDLRLRDIPVDCANFDSLKRTEREISGSSSGGRVWTMSSVFREILFVGTDNEVWDVKVDNADPLLHGPMKKLTGITGTSTAPIQAMFNGGGAGYLVYQKGGKLSAGFPTLGFRELGQMPGAVDTENVWMDGNPLNGYEIFILNSKGGLWRFTIEPDPGTTEQWTQLLEPNEEDFGWRGGLNYLEDEDVYVAGVRGRRVLRFIKGESRDVTPPQPCHPTVINQTFGLGVVLGDEEGRIWRDTGSGWEQLPGPTMAPVITIGPFYEGALYGGKDGVLSYYRDDRPECTSGIVTPQTAFVIRPLGGGGYQFLSSNSFVGESGEITVTTLLP